jgi:DNA-binding transcriptional MerR regulator
MVAELVKVPILCVTSFLLNEPGRTEGRQRRYDERTVSRLIFVRHARELGFDVDEVRELLTLADRPDDPCQSVDAIARRQVGRIDTKMKHLRTMRRELMTVITACHAARVRDCRIIKLCRSFRGDEMAGATDGDSVAALPNMSRLSSSYSH